MGKRCEDVNARRTLYALAGGVLGLGAPAGLLCIRLARRGLSVRSAMQEVQNDRETYIYTATSTTVAFALFGSVLGYFADRLAQLATTDSLTGLFNRRVFLERLRHEIGRVDRYQQPLSLLMIDLDGLKRLNDHYGHETGDAALRSVAVAIRDVLREVDFAARLGGDEFGILAPATSEESAFALAERLRARVTLNGEGSRRPITISIGMASMSPLGGVRPSAGAVMATADEALYQAKREGGDRVVPNSQR